MKFLQHTSTASPQAAAHWIQPKLEIRAPDDAYEQEADAVAERVISAPETSLQPKALQKRHALQLQSMEEEEELQTKLQRQTMEEEEEELQMKPEISWLQRQAGSASQEIESQIRSKKGGGEPLPRETKSFMESRIGADFSNVKVHADSSAAQLSERLGAQAFTVGGDVFFNTNKYRPETAEGKRLLAHELTHTLQQGATGSRIQREKITYRQLKWSDFKGEMPEGDSHDAKVAAGLKYNIDDSVTIDAKSTGETKEDLQEIKVIISYHPSKVTIVGTMNQEESGAKKWLTDDDAAMEKYGDKAEIKAARKELLKHEQLHFKNAKKMAEIYQVKAREAVPKTTYEEKIWVKNQEELKKRGNAILDQKNDELDAKIEAIKDEGLLQLAKVQKVYDDETQHSRNEKAQKEWDTKFDEQFKKAMEKKENEKKDKPEKELEHVH